MNTPKPAERHLRIVHDDRAEDEPDREEYISYAELERELRTSVAIAVNEEINAARRAPFPGRRRLNVVK